MSDNETKSSGGGLCGLLFITFLVLKLCGVINWSWWWVTAPLWGGFAIALVFLVVLLIVFLVMRIFS